MGEFGGASTSNGKYQWLCASWTRFRNLLKSRNASKCTENLAQSSQVEQSAEKFISKLIHRLEEEDIRRDNIYLMFRRKFTWRSLLPKTQKGTKEFDIQKLGNDGLIITFCTNATGTSKLSPLYFYEYVTQESLKYLKSEKAISQILKTDILKHQQIFEDWYNNHFMKSVIEHQQKTNVSGKVLLLVTNCKECILSRNIMQNDDVEMLYVPRSCISGNGPLINMIDMNLIRFKLKKVSEDFCRSYDMNIYIKFICESWAKLPPSYIKSSLETFLPDCRTEENTTSTSLVKQTKDEGMDYEEQENDKNDKDITDRENTSEYFLNMMHDVVEEGVAPDKLTEYFKSYAEIEGRECQQLENIERAENI
ncbi:jerky protein [Lasius niger]|uniref:Jerky protein n=1 Tax=Lasius niger TaxID=67767 RepID=A0A0J7MWQ3_LASNI|nr:jerky protein [Lasius niger]